MLHLEISDPEAEPSWLRAATDRLHSLIARLWLIFPVNCSDTHNPRRPKLGELFWVGCKMRTLNWYPLSSSPPASPGLPRPDESPLSLNIPRPPTLNFPNLKSISVWKSTINFTLTCWTGGKKKIISNLEIRKIRKCHRSTSPDWATLLLPEFLLVEGVSVLLDNFGYRDYESQ